MIRRVFWLTLGAAGGIMGYRRVVRLSRRSLARDAIRAARGAQGFSRDVREGMELYSSRHSRAIGPTLRSTSRGASVPSPPRAFPEVPQAPSRGASQRRPPSKKDDR
jgi:hypothetical protein